MGKNHISMLKKIIVYKSFKIKTIKYKKKKKYVNNYFKKHLNFSNFSKKNHIRSIIFFKKIKVFVFTEFYIDNLPSWNPNLKDSDVFFKVQYSVMLVKKSKKLINLSKKKFIINSKFNEKLFFLKNLVQLSVNIKLLNLLKISNILSIKKKKIYLYSFSCNNLNFFSREDKLIFYSKCYLNFFNFRKIKKKQNYIRTCLVSLRTISRVLRKTF